MFKDRHSLAAVIAILWFALVLAAAFYVSKPIRLSQVVSLAEGAADIVVVAGISILAGGLGLRLMGTAHPLSRSELVAWSAGLGLGIVSLAALFLGAVGGFHTLIIAGVLLLAAIPVRREMIEWTRLLSVSLRNALPDSTFARAWWSYLALLLMVTLLLALMPPTSWDALVYHLKGPELYIEAKRLSHPIDLPYLGFPQLGEMLFTVVLLLRRPEAAQLVSLLYGLLVALGLGGLVGRHWGKKAGLLAGAVLFSAPSLASLLSRAYVDVILVYYSLGTFASVITWRDHHSGRWLAIGGLFAGMAMGTKYTAIALLIGGLMVLWVTGGSHKMRHVSRFVAVAALAFAPWLAKNWLLTGNPIYPFFLPGVYWDSYRAWWFGRAGTGLAASNPLMLILAPWYATVWGVEGSNLFDATIGPLYLALLPLVALTWRFQNTRQKKLLGSTLLFALPAYLVWLVGLATSAQLLQTRLLFPIFPMVTILCIAGVARLEHLDQPRLLLSWVIQVLIAFALLLNLIGLTLDAVSKRPMQVLTGQLSEDQYRIDLLGWHQATIAAVNQLAPDSRVLFLWEPRSLLCQVECWPDALLDRWWHDRQRYGSPAEIAHQWRTQGFTHLLVHESGLEFVLADGFDPIDPADQQALDQLRDDELQHLESFGDAYTLYRILQPGTP